MLQITCLTFGPFQENTYVIYDEQGDCLIVDPGCYDQQERDRLKQFITDKNLQPKRLINTHGHIDHIAGNKFICTTYNLLPEIHPLDVPMLEQVVSIGQRYGLTVEPSPAPGKLLSEKDTIALGNTHFTLLHAPGHSPGSLCLVHAGAEVVIAGDVLFQGSIGRTDLPGGDHQTLLTSIKTKLFPLPDHYKVYAGHGAPTTIGMEKKSNPFLVNL